MRFDQDIFTVDTLRTLPGADAFRGGVAGLSDLPSGETAAAALAWGDSLVNCILISAEAILLVLFLNALIGILPFLLGGVFRWKELVNLEDSMRLARDRNILSLISLPALALVMSRYGLWHIAWLDSLSPGLDTLVILGVLIVVLLLRRTLVLALAPHGGRDNYMLSARVLYDFSIILALLLCATVGILAIFGVNDLAVRKILYYVAGLVYLIFLVRRVQILRNSCAQFTAILYLCSLELIPAGLLVVSGLLF